MPSIASRLLDFDTAVRAVTVTEVQLSPDGNQVVYVTGRASTEREEPLVSELWLAGAMGSVARRLASAGASASCPRWSPDGLRLAFLSDREEREVAQLYVLDLGRGGEAVRLTDEQSGVLGLAWSPDGGSIAYTAVEPKSDEEKDGPDPLVVGGDVKPMALWLVTVPDDAAALGQGELPERRRLTPDGVQVLSEPGLGVQFGWAPDGRSLVAVRTRGPRMTDQIPANLISVNLDGKVQDLLTYEAFGGSPSISPNGSTIALVGSEGAMPAMFSLMTLPVDGGTPRPLLPGYEGSVRSFAWLPDSRRLVTVLAEGQQQRLAIVEDGTVADAVQPFDRPGTVFAFSLSADGRRVAFIRADSASLPDVYLADTGGATRRLTDLNPWVRDYDLGEVRELSWRSVDDLEIQGLLRLPAGYEEGKRYPLVLSLHGGPPDAWNYSISDLWEEWHVHMAQRGYAVLLPNPRGSCGRGTDYLSGIVARPDSPDWADVMAGVDSVIDLGIADEDQLVVGGWSYGGYLTNWTITHTNRFKAAVTGAGVSNRVSAQGTNDSRALFDRYYGRCDENPDAFWLHSPIRYVKNATTPTLILFGERDSRVPPSQGYELYEGLKARGVETKLVIYPRERHSIIEREHQVDLLQRVVDWFESHLGRGRHAPQGDASAKAKANEER